ncbi:MAG: CDP-diacylglycerol---serine O-phosphatidyltransferase [Sphingomonadales bacterium]|nr:CDP-diacylglycerol---serine O-phosphatidyltransferase [Sphingomonadales bacterium]MEA3042191.1 CDP-diacylglycerol---serine O-phosphatidyltransferase [Sphingomonadales bacterium]MEA3046788.1 CDP-diacylglycerol---serine O-phosphatidyltransferase [Sphingomonadales bacterium]
MSEERRAQPRHGIPLRAVVPNAVTALALCSGLTGIRFAISADWDQAIAFVGVAAVLDGMDGRIARSLRAQTRFGAELDSLSDVIAFGVSPAIILHLWVLQTMPRFGWLFAMAYAVCMALRLARFNARIDVEDQPHKSAGFLTGVPAPAGAGLMLLPIMLWLASDRQWAWLQDYRLVAPWAAFSAFMVISSVATYSLGSFRLRRNVRLEAIVAIAILGGALFSAPWETLSLLVILYLALIPVSMTRYARIKRQRAALAGAAPVQELPEGRPARRRRSPPNAP